MCCSHLNPKGRFRNCLMLSAFNLQINTLKRSWEWGDAEEEGGGTDKRHSLPLLWIISGAIHATVPANVDRSIDGDCTSRAVPKSQILSSGMVPGSASATRTFNDFKSL